MTNLVTDYEFPKTCQRRTCANCSWYTSGLVADAIHDCDSDSFITLTNLPADWASVQRIWKNVISRAERDGHGRQDWNWLYVIEEDTVEQTVHLHALVHGKAPPHGFWDKVNDELTGGLAHVRPAHSGHGSYLTKGCVRDKQRCYVCETERLARHLELNGGRVVHNSQGFFRDPNRQPIGGLRKAVDRIRARRRRTNPEDWVIVFDPDRT
jgi:hypothetical protein